MNYIKPEDKFEKKTKKEIEELKNEIKNRMREDEDVEFEEEEISPEEIAEDIQLISTEEELEEYLEDVHSVDIAESFEEMTDDELARVLELMGEENIAEVIEDSDEELQERILLNLKTSRTIDILSYMSPDEIADLLGILDFQKSKKILDSMKKSQANKIRELLGYEEDTAGGIMTTQFIAFKENLKIKEIMEKIKKIAPKTEVIETIFVLNDRKELIGEADLRDILISPNEVKLSEITNENVMYVYPEDDQEEVARMVAKYALKVVPVINKKKNLLGIITIDDIIDVINEENTEDILKLGGVSEDEEISSSFIISVKKRLPWLLINLITAFLASFTVGIFSRTISQVVALASTMPIVSGMGGNAGTQSLTVTIRAIALDEVDFEDNVGVLIKNFLVGLINGAVLGLICGTIMYVIYQNYYLGVITFAAMVGNLIIACLVGYIVPITLKALKIDPAMASAVLLTTFTDIFGFFLFLGLATLFIDKLV